MLCYYCEYRNSIMQQYEVSMKRARLERFFIVISLMSPIVTHRGILSPGTLPVVTHVYGRECIEYPLHIDEGADCDKK